MTSSASQVTDNINHLSPMNQHDRRLMEVADDAIDACNVRKIRTLVPRLRFFVASAVLLDDHEKLEAIRRVGWRLAYLDHRLEPRDRGQLRALTKGRLSPIFWLG